MSLCLGVDSGIGWDMALHFCVLACFIERDVEFLGLVVSWLVLGVIVSLWLGVGWDAHLSGLDLTYRPCL